MEYRNRILHPLLANHSLLVLTSASLADRPIGGLLPSASATLRNGVDQWFSTFFSSRHTFTQNVFGGTPNSKRKLKKRLKSFILQIRNQIACLSWSATKYVTKEVIFAAHLKEAYGTPVEKHWRRLYGKGQQLA